ncbi:MAG: ROK family protein [Planctomycetes bacterium]|nr:ROK family protein [Planctomycetota bacterium]
MGADLGGTNLRAAVVDGAGRILEAVRLPTGAEEGPEAVLGRLAGALRGLGAGRDVAAVGVGAAGPLDPETGVIHVAPNFPGWKDVPVAARLARDLGWPVHLENDANAAAYGEAWTGAGVGVRSLVMLTLGTGVGGGLILDGRLWRGHRGLAGEVGHMVVEPEGPPCGCGARGCLESLASATAIARRAGGASARAVYDAALGGEPRAIESLRVAGRALGIALASLVNLLNPERVVLGGRVAGALDFLLPALVAELRERALAVALDGVEVVGAALGDDAGVVGAARVAWERLGGPGRAAS